MNKSHNRCEAIYSPWSRHWRWVDAPKTQKRLLFAEECRQWVAFDEGLELRWGSKERRWSKGTVYLARRRSLSPAFTRRGKATNTHRALIAAANMGASCSGGNGTLRGSWEVWSQLMDGHDSVKGFKGQRGGVRGSEVTDGSVLFHSSLHF